ncbi:hypothetical protein Dimus_029465 [Dionaea muscipula]
MNDNGLEALFALIKRHKWEKLFARRDLVYKPACREFYKNLTMRINSKKEIAKSRVHGVDIELDGMILASIIGIPGNWGLCDYVKEVWEEAKYYKPLEITRKFSNDQTIMKAGRVTSIAMRPFQRDQFFDAVDDERPADHDVPASAVLTPIVLVAPVQTSVQPTGKTVVTGVDPSGPLGHLPDFELIHLQAEFPRALQANTRFQELYQQLKSNPPTSPKP